MAQKRRKKAEEAVSLVESYDKTSPADSEIAEKRRVGRPAGFKQPQEVVDRLRAYRHTQDAKDRISAALRLRVRKPVSEETREKLRRANVGKHQTQVAKNKLSAFFKGRVVSPEVGHKISEAKKGHTVSPETRKKLSDSLMGRFRGDKHPLWRGGYSKYGSGFTPALKNHIRGRDGFVCFVCGAEEVNKHHAVHHIDYSRTNHAESNLVTLCLRCHTMTNFRREHWIVYFKG